MGQICTRPGASATSDLTALLHHNLHQIHQTLPPPPASLLPFPRLSPRRPPPFLPILPTGPDPPPEMSSSPSLTAATETASASSVDVPSSAPSCKAENIARRMRRRRQREREAAAASQGGADIFSAREMKKEKRYKFMLDVQKERMDWDRKRVEKKLEIEREKIELDK